MAYNISRRHTRHSQGMAFECTPVLDNLLDIDAKAGVQDEGTMQVGRSPGLLCWRTHTLHNLAGQHLRSAPVEHLHSRARAHGVEKIAPRSNMLRFEDTAKSMQLQRMKCLPVHAQRASCGNALQPRHALLPAHAF